MDQITSTFPLYPLQGKVENDTQASYTRQTNGNPMKLPRLPSHVGGDVDFMVGIKYMRYIPEQIFQLPFGLTIYQFRFFNADGYSDGVIGGPHEIFHQIDEHRHFNQLLTHFVKTHQVQDQSSTLQSAASNFHPVENASSEINFRCVKSPSCNTCKKHNTEKTLSIKKELEQKLINRSVTIDVSMGPVSPHNLYTAPAFFITQVDLAGLFSASSHHHKRATIKIWLVVYCCATTTAVKIKVMENYGTASFLNTFTRFSCDVSYPKKLLTDEGRQLLKGCQSMRIGLQDINHKLHSNLSVEFQACPVVGHNMHRRGKKD